MDEADLDRMYSALNRRLFFGHLPAPLITVAVPRGSTILATCCPIIVDPMARPEITFHPDLLDGSHPYYATGSFDRRGIERFLSDLMLHEMLHALVWRCEGRVDPRPVHDGHGPLYCDWCRRVTPLLDNIRRQAEDRLTVGNCHDWPFRLRDRAYYLGAVRVERPKRSYCA
jgi:hypothetical protein